MKENGPDSRRYIKLIEKVGSHHRYQLVICLIMVVLNIIQTAAIFMMPYLLHQNSYTCQSLTPAECNKFVCSLDQSLRKQYLTASPFVSLADQLGDFRCEKSQQLNTLQSLIFVGGIAGMCLFCMEKKSFLSSMVIFFIGIMIIFFAQSTLSLGFGILVCFAGAQTAIHYTTCYSSEVVNQKYRFKFNATIAFTDSFGIMVNSIAFKFINHWKSVFLWVYILPMAALILAIIYYIEQTPIDLLSRESSEEIVRVLHKIADFNSVSNPELDIQAIEKLRLQYHSQSKKQAFNPLDLCRFKSLRPILLSLIIANFFSNYLFYAPSFIQKTASSDLFLDNIIAGVSKMVSVIFVYYTLTKLQRKKAMLFLNISIVIFSVMSTMHVFKSDAVLKYVVFFVFRLKVSVLQSITYTLNFETFPTQIRATAAIICYISAETAGITQPWMNRLAENLKLANFYIFAIFGLLNCINTFFIRQTFGVPPPEIIEQLHHEDPRPSECAKGLEKSKRSEYNVNISI